MLLASLCYPTHKLSLSSIKQFICADKVCYIKSLCKAMIDYLPRAAEYGDNLSSPSNRLCVILIILFLSVGFPP